MGYKIETYSDIDEEFTLDKTVAISCGFVATLSPKTIEITLHEPTLVSRFVIKNEYPCNLDLAKNCK